MKAVEALDVLERISTFWPARFTMAGPTQATEWAEAMGSVTREEALDAVLRLSRTSEWPPSVYQVREVVAGRRGLLAPESAVAFKQMQAWLFYDDQKAFVNGSGYNPRPPKVHPAVRAGAARMGGDWKTGFRFEWPKIKDEYDKKILEGS